MKKYDLRQQNFSMKDKEQNPMIVNMMWVFLTMFFIVSTFSSILKIVGKKVGDGFDPLASLYDHIGVIVYFLLLIVAMIIYMALKFIITLFFCQTTAAASIRLKMLEGNAMPVCFCREAFKIWQTLVIYCVPIVSMYGLIFFLCVLSAAGAAYILVLFFMSFFMCYDLTLVLYVLLFKIKDRADYISIDHHVYYMTLYKKSYVKLNKKAQKLNPVKQ